LHEKALMEDVLRKLGAVAREEGSPRVTRVRVRLGALSHFTPGHFREHFDDAARGTVAEGAELEIEAGDDPLEANAQGVVVEAVEVEVS
jgi:hydrogenase nickel incorporation protein HypA/HybF